MGAFAIRRVKLAALKLCVGRLWIGPDFLGDPMPEFEPSCVRLVGHACPFRVYRIICISRSDRSRAIMRKVYNRRAGKTYLYMTVTFTGESALADKVAKACLAEECSESELAKRALREYLHARPELWK